MVHLVWVMLRVYSELSAWAMDERPVKLLWNEVPKMHYMAHIALMAAVCNPRWCWCYTDEDFMRIVKKIAESSTAGTPSHLISLKVCSKWAYGVSHRMSESVTGEA